MSRRRNNRGFNSSDINANNLGVADYQGEPYGLYLTVTDKFTVGGGTNSASKFNDNFIALEEVYPNGSTPLTCAGYGSYGNIGRNTFRGLPNYQFDAQLSRTFPLHERLNAVLRLEAFNVLNHPNFSTPTTSFSSSTFGQISATASGSNPRLFQGSVKFNF